MRPAGDVDHNAAQHDVARAVAVGEHPDHRLGHAPDHVLQGGGSEKSATVMPTSRMIEG